MIDVKTDVSESPHDQTNFSRPLLTALLTSAILGSQR